MSTKPYRVVLIEPDSTRWPMIRSAFAKSSPDLEFQVVSSLPEARSQIDSSPFPLIFSALSPAQLCGKSADSTPDSLAETDDSPHPLANFSHALRSSLGIILNAAFLIKRSTPGDEAFRKEYLEMIEKEIFTIRQHLTDFLDKPQ